MAGQLERGWSVVRRAAPVLGLALLVLIWEMVSLATAAASPSPRYNQAARCSATVLRKGPNDQGVGWNVLSSLARRASAWRRWSAFRSAS
jgi:nitrate/nitrite transport system permease protein